MTQSIKPLYVKAYINEKLIKHMLFDKRLTVNIILMLMMQRFQKSIRDLIKKEMSITSFVGEVTKSLGVLPVELTVSTQITLMAFFMVKSLLSYNALLNRD